MPRSRRPVVLIAPFPPPVQGASVVAAALEAALSSLAPTIRIDTAPRHARPLAKPEPGDRAVVLLRGLGLLLGARLQGARQAYMSVAGGAGLWINLALAIPARALGMRLTFDHHSFGYVDAWDRRFALLLRAGGRRARHLVLCRAMQAGLAARYGRIGPSRVVGNAGRLAEMPAATAAPEGKLVLGHFGNLEQAKGLGLVLALWERVRGLPVALHMGGPAPDPADRAAIEAAVARDPGRVVWAGPLHGADKASFLAGLDLFVMPTRYRNEAQPLVLIEALAAGVAPLAYGRGCIAEDFAEAGGLIVPPDADFVEPAARLVASLAADPGARADLRREARAAYRRLREGALPEFEAAIRELAE